MKTPDDVAAMARLKACGWGQFRMSFDTSGRGSPLSGACMMWVNVAGGDAKRGEVRPEGRLPAELLEEASHQHGGDCRRHDRIDERRWRPASCSAPLSFEPER